MKSITLNIQDNIYEKVIFFLQNLPQDKIEIIKHPNKKNDHQKNNTQELQRLFSLSQNKTCLTMKKAIDTNGLSDDFS